MFATGSVIPICLWDKGSFSKFGCLEEMVVALTYFVCIGYLESPCPEHIETVSQHSPLSRGSGLRDCSLFQTGHSKAGIRIRLRALGAWGLSGSQGHMVLLAEFLGVRTFH